MNKQINHGIKSNAESESQFGVLNQEKWVVWPTHKEVVEANLRLNKSHPHSCYRYLYLENIQGGGRGM